jgi:hypothetical protein
MTLPPWYPRFAALLDAYIAPDGAGCPTCGSYWPCAHDPALTVGEGEAAWRAFIAAATPRELHLITLRLYELQARTEIAS